MEELDSVLKSGHINYHDRWQFELKSEFNPHIANNYIQEFYLFIPNVLQINSESYSKADFYLDQTNLIRFKTPESTFEELLDAANHKSPLYRLKELLQYSYSEDLAETAVDEIKLFGNMVKSSLKREVRNAAAAMQMNTHTEENLRIQLETCAAHISVIQAELDSLEKLFSHNWKSQVFTSYIQYVQEFIGYAILEYGTVLLDHIRTKHAHSLRNVDKKLCDLLIYEKKLLDARFPQTDNSGEEYILLSQRTIK